MVWVEVGGRPATRTQYKSMIEARASAIRKIEDAGSPIMVAAVYPNKNCKESECLGVVVRHTGGYYTWNRKTRKGIVEQPLLKNGKIKR